MSTIRVVLGLSAVLSCFSTRPALAARKQSLDALAHQACLSGDYAEGVSILSKLFVATRESAHIFNQGRCFEQNRRYEDAISRFQEFLRVTREKPNKRDTAEAERHIAECKEMLAQERASAGSISPRVSVPEQPTTRALPEQPTSMRLPLQINAPEAQLDRGSPGSGMRVGGIIVASAGVLFLGTGALFNLKANSIVNDMYSTWDGYSRESDRKTYATLTWLGYGIGTACVVTGATLYAVGTRKQSTHSSGLAVWPVVGIDQAGAMLSGAF